MQSTRDASSGLPWTERIRRKMWGSDNPPGLKDPYGGPGYFERRRQEAQAERGRGQIPTEPTIVEHEPALPEPGLPEMSTLEEESAQNTEHSHAQDMMRSRSVPENDPEKEDLTYVQAETWNGLEQVGLSGHWSETPPTPADSFRPYLAAFEKASSWKEILSALHQAVVEVVTLRDSRLPLTYSLGHIAYKPDVLAALSTTTIEFDYHSKQIVLKYKDGGRRLMVEAILGDDLQRSISPYEPVAETTYAEVPALEANGDTTFTAPDQESQELRSQEADFPGQDIEYDGTHTFVATKEEMNNGNGDQYKNNIEDLPPQKRTAYTVTSADFITMPLEPLELRFAVIKRASQLTGHRIPDPLITARQSLSSIYSYLGRDRDSPPKKVADRLLIKPDVINLPNVHIMPRRETPVDKDKRLGRWKIIEAELHSKGLPVLGKSRV
ncbi:hypothetical protein GJ744_005444 [Endocarpon pusillum]|uniref:Large ribosomal subunit protein mL50 n=1 Tax=Endocarpon pusillum TaxID=364733 RepID=A0A8H7DZK6_9EURO|nr:hypothetical protein GJ744_005444 [Endocarpon pusillum]